MNGPLIMLPAAEPEPIVAQAERRKNRRFALRQPVTLRYEDGGIHELNADTVNASLRGMLLLADHEVPRDATVEVTLRLQKEGLQPIALHGNGRVIRQETRSDAKSVIAILFRGQLD